MNQLHQLTRYAIVKDLLGTAAALPAGQVVDVIPRGEANRVRFPDRPDPQALRRGYSFSTCDLLSLGMELKGVEPSTSGLQNRRSPN